MDRPSALALIEALGAEGGIVAAVGAGGKKTTLARLAEAHLAAGTRRIALTSTVQIATPVNASAFEAVAITADTADQALASIDGRTGCFFLPGAPTKPGRFAGLPEDLIPRVHGHGGFDVTLVKADGARMRMIKAPSDHEPALPDRADVILPIVSARAFGRPLDQRIAHRPERLAEVVSAVPGDMVMPEHVARLLASEEGALRHVGHARVVPVINMADTEERLTMAGEAARQALTMTGRFDRVVLAAMAGETPVVEVISA